MKDSVNRNLANLFNTLSQEEEMASKADLLSLQFLGLVDQKMEELGMSKKELAQRVGTSASFITQLFRGDRKPSWKMLAKMETELGIEFKVTTQELFQERLRNKLKEYHQRLAESQELVK